MNKHDTVQYAGSLQELNHWGVDQHSANLIVDAPIGIVEHIFENGIMIKFETAGSWVVDKDHVFKVSQ